MTNVIRNAYAQWCTAELVIYYHQENGHLPKSWAELEPYFKNGQGLHAGGMSFAKLQRVAVVDFARLTELQSLAQVKSKTPSLPKIIHPMHGSGNWTGAEPNQLIYDYFVQKRSTPVTKESSVSSP
ncbi:MAG: hypothetical protein ABIP97_09335 [Chthoniobacterales bacterium]